MDEVPPTFDDGIAAPTSRMVAEGEVGVEDQDSILLLERRSFRPFKNAEDYLYAMREDLAEWLNSLYGLTISVDDFFERLENGVLLCEHANNVRQSYEEHRRKNGTNGRQFSTRYTVPPYDVHYRRDSAPGSFFARDNIHNFIRWCRDLGVHDVLMFETDDLVLRKNEKHVILALLEIARRGARFGMAAPLLVQMEDDIDREIEKNRLALENSQRASQEGHEGDGIEWEEESAREKDTHRPNLIYGPQPQVVTNDLLSLDEMVRDLVERCSCPSQFPMVKVSEGKYLIGDTKVVIFVRILRNHVMVRVGGGWDTLHHYLDKHDPCRCKSGHRVTISSKIGFKTPNPNERQLSSVTYERSEEGYSPLPRRRSNCFRRDSSDGTRPSLRQRSQSPALRENSNFLNTPNSPRVGFRGLLPKEDNAASSPDVWCDSSSEVSDEGYKSQGPPRSTLRSRKLSPKKPVASDISERPCSSMTHLSSDGSSASADDIGVPPSPPHTPPTNAPSFSPWNSTPKPTSQIPRCTSSKNKLVPTDHLFANKPKSKSILSQPGRRAWNAGPGLRAGEYDNRGRRSSISDTMEGRKLSRSRSATSEGGFQTMIRKDLGGRHFTRSSVGRPPIDIPQAKNTWNGRSRQRDYPPFNAESFRPPTGVRSVRSASASPAATRKVYTSAPSTPANRSPKRSTPTPNFQSPTLPPEILSKFPDISGGDGDAEILAKLEGFVSNYRAYVLDKLAAEGRSPPPELTEEEWDKDVETTPLKDIKIIPSKPNPRKSGLGSRIPAPVF